MGDVEAGSNGDNVLEVGSHARQFLHCDFHGVTVDLVGQYDRAVGAVLPALGVLVDLLVVVEDGCGRETARVVLAHDLPVVGVLVPQLKAEAHLGGDEADAVVDIAEGSPPCGGGHANDLLDGLASVPHLGEELLVRETRAVVVGPGVHGDLVSIRKCPLSLEWPVDDV